MGAFRLKNMVVTIMETDTGGLDASRTRLAADLADISANSAVALREACEAVRASASGQSVA